MINLMHTFFSVNELSLKKISEKNELYHQFKDCERMVMIHDDVINFLAYNGTLAHPCYDYHNSNIVNGLAFCGVSIIHREQMKSFTDDFEKLISNKNLFTSNPFCNENRIFDTNDNREIFYKEVNSLIQLFNYSYQTNEFIYYSGV